ncbi:hypothetical protein [Methylocystis sp. JR02]|uniref:hypothetical protein n=1 Tax=Methylocystis sp. JR02 TaxID=3046284 RepID=UPI0024B8E095|nr:hypothetical protein [Methylocystis sp. JR02]MDJ0449251.1 hypothetical protein [Methylocystis sp. JR02]
MTEAELIAWFNSSKPAILRWIFDNLINVTVLGGALALIWKTYVKVKIDESVKRIYADELERLKADLNTRLEVQKSELVTKLEETKYTLKNSEFIFSERVKALTRLRKYARGMLPLPTTPDADWDQAAEHIARHWKEILDWLEEFLGEVEACLPREVSEKLNRAASIAVDLKFEFDWVSEREDVETSRTGLQKAGELHDAFSEAIELLQSNVARNFRDVLP